MKRTAPKRPKVPKRLPTLDQLLSRFGDWLLDLVWAATWALCRAVANLGVTMLALAAIGAGKAAQGAWRGGRSGTARASYAIADRWTEKRPVAAQRAMRLGDVVTRTVRVTCASCGTTVRADESDEHNKACTKNTVRELAAARQARRTPQTTTTHPASSAPSAHTTATTGGTSVNEIQAFIRAAGPLADMDPQDAWELDAQLRALANAGAAIANALADYVEHLDRVVKVDPRIIQTLSGAVSEVSTAFVGFAHAGQQFRDLYASAFEAAQSGVRQTKDGFFDASAA